MKLKMLTVAMVCALASVMISESADAQHRGRGRHGGGYGNGYGNGSSRYCAPRYVQPRVYYGNNNCAPRYNNRQVVYRGYNNCPPPRYTRVMRPTCAPPPVYNNYYGGYNQGGYNGGSGVSVNVNTPGFSGSFNSGNGGYYRR